MAFWRGDAAGARRHNEAALELSRKLGDRRGEASFLMSVGSSLWLDARFADAAARYERSVALAREIDHAESLAGALQSSAYAALQLGRLEEAWRHASEALEVFARFDSERGRCDALSAMSAVARDAGRLEEAERLARDAAARASKLGDRYYMSMAHDSVGTVLRARGDLAGAREQIAAALRGAREAGATILETLAACELASLSGDAVEAALTTFESHRKTLGAHGRKIARWWLWRATGDAVHLERAKSLLDEAVAGLSDDDRSSMLERVPVNRDIVEAWRSRSADAQS